MADRAAGLVRVGALLLQLSAAASAAAQERQPAPSERLVIEHADETQRLAQGDSVSYYLDGNVRAHRGDLRLTAQHVVILEWLGVADFSRDVHLWDPENELYADHVTYTDSTDVAVANGDVQIVERESGSQLKSQQAVYDRWAGVLTATEKPEMLVFPGAEADAPADSAPEPIHVWSRQVQLFRDTDEAVATGDVLIERAEEITAKADSARFAMSGERVVLRGRPRVETDRFYIEARDIDVLLPADELEALVARGAARATSRSDSIPAEAVQALGDAGPNSWISADSLHIGFRDDIARDLRAIGDARSLSYSLESRAGDAATWALSYLLAGRITFVFDEVGEGLDRVEASQDGRGIYRTAALTGAEPDTMPPAPPGAADGAGEEGSRTGESREGVAAAAGGRQAGDEPVRSERR